MNRYKHIITAFSACLAVCALLFHVWTPQNQTPQVRSNHGVLDLINWNFDKQGGVKLQGPWEEYRNKLVEPLDFALGVPPVPDRHVSLPMVWKDQKIDGITYQANSFSTYRLKIRIWQTDQILAIRMADVMSAYRLWLDGRIIGESGQVGRNAQEEIPRHSLDLVQFTPDKSEFELILQVSNHHYRIGGPRAVPILGLSQDIQKSQIARWGLTMLLTGCIIIMSFYHIGIYLLRRDNAAPLLCGLYCLLMVTKGLESRTSDWFIHQVFPAIPWSILYRIELISLYLSTAVVFYFTRSLYPQESPLKPCRWSLGIAMVFSLATLFLPVSYFTRLITVFYFFLYIYMSWGLFIVAMAVKNRRPRAVIILMGLFLLIVTGVYDMLHDTYLDPTPSILNIGVFAFILCQCWALAVNFSEAFTSVEHLSGELGEKNADLARLNELKDEFLANTSHELRTPLNGMVGIAESMINSPESRMNPTDAANIEIIIACGKRLGNLINDILDFSRLKHKDVQLNRKPTDVRALTDVILSVFRILISKKPVTLTNTIPQDTPAVFADEDRLQQILFNLVGNAVKYTDNGDVTISATHRDGFVHVTVADTGPGISPDRLEAIFMPFEQDDARPERRSDGTGLGLPITQKLVVLHGGTISVNSTPRVGSSFTFTLPTSNLPISTDDSKDKTRPLNAIPAAIMDAPAPVIERPGHRVYVVSTPSDPVLVVDDDSVNLQVVSNHLNMASIPCITASNGLEAIEMIENGIQPSIILLDIMMPQVDGYEICRRLRETHSSAELPIVMLTARNRMEDLVLGLNAGANDYLVKPFSRDELIARVNTQLKIRKSYDTMKENIRLKREIDQRKATEQELLINQRKLSRMLDSLEDAMVAVNESLEISFCNESYETLTGNKTRHMLGKPVAALFSTPPTPVLSAVGDSFSQNQGKTESFVAVTLACEDRPDIEADIEMTSLELDHERLLMLMIRDARSGSDKSQSNGMTLAMIEELNANRMKLRELEFALNTLSPAILENNPPFSHEIKSIEKALENLEHSLVPDSRRQDKRRLAVNLMNLSIDYWQTTTGNDKVALAQGSNLWKVYMDTNGWERTQTLDKYLDLQSLPQRPRWDHILKTADFVLSTCDTPSPLRDQIESAQRQLRLQA